MMGRSEAVRVVRVLMAKPSSTLDKDVSGAPLGHEPNERCGNSSGQLCADPALFIVDAAALFAASCS
jgi:hypothetical protein